MAGLDFPAEVEPNGRWEYWCLLSHEVSSLSAYFPQNDAIVLDVGANKGLWGLAADFMYGARINELHIIEPSSFNVAAINATREKGGFQKSKKVFLHQIGLGEKTETLTLYSDTPGSALATFTGATASLTNGVVEMTHKEGVDVFSLDDFAESHRLKQIDFLKIDTEGFEMNIFRGAKGLLSRKKIGGFMFEFGINQIRTKDNFIEFWDLLRGYGYNMLYLPCGDGGISPRKITAYNTHWESKSYNRYFLATLLAY